jgi:signal peptidase I
LVVAAVGVLGLALYYAARDYRVYTVRTGSMQPTIPIGSAVVVRRGSVRIGQVITFHVPNGSGLETHRLIAIRPDGNFVTKGDGNPTPDVSELAPKAVLGHVVAAPRRVGAWMDFLLHSWQGFVFDTLALCSVAVLLSGGERGGRHRRGGRTGRATPAYSD